MILFLEAVILLGILLYLYLTWHHNHWQKLGVASDRPSAIFGNFKKSTLMKCNRGEEIDDLYKKFPNEKLVGFYILRRPGLLVRDPELVHKVLVTDFHSFRNNDIEVNYNNDDPMGKNIFLLTDEEWKRSRALITPAFTTNKIKGIFPQMIGVAEDFVKYLRQHPEEMNIKKVMSRYTTEIIAKCAFGIESFAFKEEKSDMYEVGRSIFEPTLKNNFAFLVFTIFPEINKILNMRFIGKGVTKFFNSILHDIIVYRQKCSVQRNDLIQYLIDLKKKSLEIEKGNISSEVITKPYTDDDILANCVMFFVEAYETSALVLTNILYYLALNKDSQEKLREEIDTEMEKGELSYEGINEMQYLHCVFQETNRLAPVLHFLFKRCTERYEFDLGNGKSVPVEKGTSITIPIYGLQTDPIYWNDALEFKPERFLNKEQTQVPKIKTVFIPFGEGPRMCIGMKIASMIIKIALIHILSTFEVLPVESTPKKIKYDPCYLMMMHKGGIYLRFAERNKK